MKHARLLLAVLCVQAQGLGASQASTPTRVVPLKLEAQGAGPALAAPLIEHTTDFDGTLHLWTKADGFDLRLRVEDGTGELLAEDEDSGGGKTPYLALVVAQGQKLSVIVSGARLEGSAAKDSSGAPDLHLAPAPESAAARAATDEARADLAQIAALVEEGSGEAARAAVAELVDALVDADVDGLSELVSAALWDAGVRADKLGALKPATIAFEATVKHRERVLDGDHPDLQAARQKLGFALRTQGELARARELQESVIEVRTRTCPADDVELAMARIVLGETILQLGDLPGARSLAEQGLEVLVRLRPEDDHDLNRARLSLASTIRAMGDLAGARALDEKVHEVFSRTLPPDHIDLQDARGELAVSLMIAGDLAGARTLLEEVLEVFGRTLPDDHPNVSMTQQNLAYALHRLGDLNGARKLQEKSLEVLSRTLPEDHPDLQVMRSNLAASRMALGDIAGARELFERVLDVRARTLTDEHPNLQRARNNLAVVLLQLGELASARAIQERLLETYTRTLADDHPELQAARGNLALTILALGDVARARELFEKVLEMNARTLPADHSQLQQARHNLASALTQMGDLEGARALQEKVLEVYARTVPADNPEVQLARSNLALTLMELGDVAGARELLEQAVEVDARTLPADHPHLQAARMNLGTVLRKLGEYEEARALEESVLEVYLRTLPEGHVNLQRARLALCWTLAALGEREAALSLAADVARARRDAVSAARGALAPREIEEQVASVPGEFSTVLSLSLGAGRFEPSPELTREAFSLVESARSAGLFSAVLSPALRDDPELRELRVQEKTQSAALVQLAQKGTASEEITAARRALDVTRARRQTILAADPKARATMLEPTVERLSAVLAPDQALVAYWRARCQEPRRADGSWPALADHLLAFVARPGAKLSLVDLGRSDAIEAAVERWREVIFARVQRGLAPDEVEADANGTDAGQALRVLVWDPLDRALGDARRVIVALDDALHAVPLEALPESDGLLGERIALEHHLSLRELLWPQDPRVGSELLVALGGANFNAEPAGFEDPTATTGSSDESAGKTALASAPSGAAKTGIAAALRAGPWERGFEPLTETLAEARGLGALYEQTFENVGRAVVLEKRQASRDALTELAPRARWLHLATHGWFAAESVASTGDPRVLDEKFGTGLSMSTEQQVRGSSPMVLCGLALAGANRPTDQLGRVRGLITAEEIASLDLSHCELAVLSACDTNVGVRRAGQGVASLQKALHMAGARSVITSLWKVPDEATKELMLDFYRRLWVEKKSKSAALWAAKMKIRGAKDENGKPKYRTRDWAAWVLTGSPE